MPTSQREEATRDRREKRSLRGCATVLILEHKNGKVAKGKGQVLNWRSSHQKEKRAQHPEKRLPD